MNQRTEYYNRILQERPIYKDVFSKLETGTKGTYTDAEQLYLKVFMPTLVEFISWILEDASRNGKKRLYFLARDGYQMYLVAKRLCQIKGIPMECRYLKVSRYAMRTPEYHLLKENAIEYICLGGIDVTVERIMNRAGLPKEAAAEYLPEEDPKRLLNYKEIMDLKEVLRKNDNFLQRVYDNSKAAYDPAIAYLRQEGLFDEIDYALVDSGWIGTLQKTIANLVGREQLEGYYFGMYGVPKDVSPDNYHAFFFGPKWGLKQKVHFSNCLFEAVFTSPEGMTLCYGERNGHYEAIPDFHENSNKILIERNCLLLENYMDVYEKLLQFNVSRHEKNNSGGVTSRKERADFIEKLLEKCMGYPTKLEVGAYGDLLFSDDVLEGNLKKVAADLTIEEIRNQRFLNKVLIMLGIKKGGTHESAWIEGSIVKEGHGVEKNLFHAKIYKYFVYIRKMLR